jgi:putative DNA primase/helicase
MPPSTKERARGRWRQILPALGIAGTFLTGRNVPCPMCGGRDRFRFIDRLDADGMWVCNQCQPQPRPAIDLVIAYTGKPFPEAARTIDEVLGHNRQSSNGAISPHLPEQAKVIATASDGAAYAKKIWRRGVGVRPGDIVDRYLRSRGVGVDLYPPCLRTNALDWHWDEITSISSSHPTMLAMVTNPNGEHVATHRTFLADDGLGKANLAKPRKVTGKYGRGPTIRLMPPAPLMGIAEGIETAISAALLFGVPTWSVICAGGIESFQPPPECRHLIVFADNDKHGVSQRAARSLTARLSIRTEIKMPDRPGTDWNDTAVRG